MKFACTLILTDVAQGIVKCHLLLVKAVPMSKSRLVRHRTVCEVVCPQTVREKCPQLLNRTLILTRSSPRNCKMTFIYHRSRLCLAPNSVKVKMALSLEPNGIF